jgi:hypothetical protein
MDPMAGDGAMLVAAFRRLAWVGSAKLRALPPEEVSMPTDPTLAQIARTMTLDQPIGGEEAEALAKSAKAFARAIVRLCPDSRERSLAITNAEQSLMWARTSIAQNGTAKGAAQVRTVRTAKSAAKARAATATRTATTSGRTTRTRAATPKRMATKA